MDFKIKRKNTKTSIVSNVSEFYPHDLQMYNLPPIENISLREFETLALERLTLLRSLYTTSTLKGLKIFSDEWKEEILNDLKSQGLKYYLRLCEKSGCGKTEADFEARRKDHISHFILRLAYCRTEELRRWFVSRECELFKMKFMTMGSEATESFFKLNNLCYTSITEKEKNEVISYLRECTYHQNIDNLKIYKVKFHEVLDLVRARKVYLSNGYAYIIHRDFISVLSAQYKKHLKQSLAIALHHLSEVEQDERIVSLLKGLHKSYTGNDYTNAKVAIPIASLDSLSSKSFPLCMRSLHEQLRANHHLKHGGRLQYGLFLKGIGVTLEDSLTFWRDEFTKIMDLDKFEKQYSYNIRYNYGKEGSKRNYSPFSCMKIINEAVGPTDCHGCPFKNCDVNNLKNKLIAYGYQNQGISEIIDFAKKGHYQIACSKYFDINHNTNLGLGINHPNQYFEESQKLQKANVNVEIKKEIKEEVIKSNEEKMITELEEMDIEFNQ